MFGDAFKLIGKATENVPFGEPAPAPVTFKFPKDHPAAAHLRRAFKLYQTMACYDSGLEVQYAPPDDDSVAAFLNELRAAAEASGVDFDMATKDILGWSPEQDPGLAASQLLVPQNLGKIMGSIFKHPETSDVVGPSVRRRYINMADELEGKR